MSHLEPMFPQRVDSLFGLHESLVSAGGGSCGDVSGLRGWHMRLCGGEGEGEEREE